MALPPERRIRVVLADTPIDFGRVQSIADADYVRTMENETDQQFADRVEQEVVAQGHRALIIAGGGHLRRGLHADIHPRTDDPGQPPNAGTLIAQHHPGQLYTIDTLITGYLRDPGDSAGPRGARRRERCGLGGTRTRSTRRHVAG